MYGGRKRVGEGGQCEEVTSWRWGDGARTEGEGRGDGDEGAAVEEEVKAIGVCVGKDGQAVQRCVGMSYGGWARGEDMPILREVSIGEVGEN